MTDRDDTGELGEFYDVLIEDMLAGYQDVSADRIDREFAVELFETVHAVRLYRIESYGKDHPSTALTLPPGVEAVVLACAKQGVGKGRGKGGKRHSTLTEFKIMGAVHGARERKAALVKGGKPATGNNSAEEIAAREAIDALRREAGLDYKLDYMISLMRRPARL